MSVADDELEDRLCGETGARSAHAAKRVAVMRVASDCRSGCDVVLLIYVLLECGARERDAGDPLTRPAGM
jgi:hypothetical protein